MGYPCAGHQEIPVALFWLNSKAFGVEGGMEIKVTAKKAPGGGYNLLIALPDAIIDVWTAGSRADAKRAAEDAVRDYATDRDATDAKVVMVFE